MARRRQARPASAALACNAEERIELRGGVFLKLTIKEMILFFIRFVLQVFRYLFCVGARKSQSFTSYLRTFYNRNISCRWRWRERVTSLRRPESVPVDDFSNNYTEIKPRIFEECTNMKSLSCEDHAYPRFQTVAILATMLTIGYQPT